MVETEDVMNSGRCESGGRRSTLANARPRKFVPLGFQTGSNSVLVNLSLFQEFYFERGSDYDSA